MTREVTLQQFRALQLPPLVQSVGQVIGAVGVLYWFWWVLIEKGFLQVLISGDPALQTILLGVPLFLILPAIYYTAIFILLRVMVWILKGREPVNQSDPPAL